MVATFLLNKFKKLHKAKTIQPNCPEKAAEFLLTELCVLKHWIDVLGHASRILNLSTQKQAKKEVNKYDNYDYINRVIRPLVNAKSSYKSSFNVFGRKG